MGAPISVRPELVEGVDGFSARAKLACMPPARSAAARGQSLSLFRQRKEPKKGDPDIRPDPGLTAETSRGPKLAALKQRAASSTFLLSIPGSHARGPRRTDS